MLTALLIQQSLFAMLWCALAILGLARRAALHWAVGVLFVTGGLSLIVLRDVTPAWLGYWLSVVMLSGGLTALCRGLDHFVRRPPADREYIIGWLLHCALVAAVTLHGVPWMFVAAASAPLGYWQLRAAWTVQRGLSGEFGASFAAWCAAPFWLIGTVLVLRGLLAPLLPQVAGTSLHAPGAGNLGAAFTFVGAGLLLDLGLVALVCSRMLRRLQRASDHDGLTGLLNRRGIESRLQLEANRLGRYGQPYSVLSIDVDLFKHINDRHGHPAGDAVLRALGQTLVRAGRDVDLAGRTGGEEFLIVMPHTAADSARALAERLLQTVRALRVPVAGDGLVSTTVSIGVVTAERADEPLQAVMQRLDAALYRAKQAGRDRIELAVAAAPAGGPQESLPA